MKILVVFRNKGGESWKIVESLSKNLRDLGHKVDILSREDDLGIDSLSGSMGVLKETIKRKNNVGGYDIIYTNDWSIAFPLLIPERVFEKEHYCFFHNVEPKGQSKIFQRIVGNMMGDRLIVRTEKLKEIFLKSTLSPEGIKEDIFKK